jgi:hypothetical protein
MLSSGAWAAWRSAQWYLEIETQRLMDTSVASDPKSLLAAALGKAGNFNLRFGGRLFPHITLNPSIEDWLCLAVALAQLSLLFFFENWGLQGPQSFRWAAIGGHCSASLALLAGARLWLLVEPPSPAQSGQESTGAVCSSPRGGGALWLCLTLGHWICITWAGATWWHSAAQATARAAAAAAAAADAPAVGGPLEPDSAALLQASNVMHIPLVAFAIVHVANVLNARRAREPVLLFVCVVLSGISMGASCCFYCSTPGVTWLVARSRASILPIFCATSAWVLWQQLVQSLSLD